MENYTKVQQCFEKEGCALLTTFEEFEEARATVLGKSYHHVRVKFIGSCTHESSAVYTNFNLRKTGLTCKDCLNKINHEKLKKNKNTNEIEYEGIKIIEECLSPHYEVIRTKEGCLADIAIRKKGTQDDSWIPMQVKVTQKNSHGMYSFAVNNTYKDMLMICICISEQKIWIIPFNDITLKAKLNISVKSKYSKYLIDNQMIHTVIDKYESKIIHNNIDTILLPVNPTQQREQQYVKKRETHLPFLAYEYPHIQNTCVDVIVNGKKIQEKVLGINEYNKGFYCGLAANSSKLDGKRQYRSYQLGENDYYWLHSNIDDRFWIIPEKALYDKGYISNANEIKSKKTLWFKPTPTEQNKWLDDYEFSYSNVNRDAIMKLFE